MKMKIGIIGSGNMGSGLARRITLSGHGVLRAKHGTGIALNLVTRGKTAAKTARAA